MQGRTNFHSNNCHCQSYETFLGKMYFPNILCLFLLKVSSKYNHFQKNLFSQALKRQLKDSRDTVQRQRMEIEGMKSRLDMSVSKLTGTEKALSEALRDYKQEKDKVRLLSVTQ